MAETPTTSKPLQCVVVTPEKAVLDETCDFIALPMFDGELGVLPGRVAMIGRLGFGELRTTKGKVVRRYYVDGGFVQVKNNVVTVLTQKAIKGEDINATAAQEMLKAAQVPTNTAEAQSAQLKAQERARAQIRVAENSTAVAGLSLDNV